MRFKGILAGVVDPGLPKTTYSSAYIHNDGKSFQRYIEFLVLSDEPRKSWEIALSWLGDPNHKDACSDDVDPKHLIECSKDMKREIDGIKGVITRIFFSGIYAPVNSEGPGFAGIEFICVNSGARHFPQRPILKEISKKETIELMNFHINYVTDKLSIGCSIQDIVLPEVDKMMIGAGNIDVYRNDIRDYLRRGGFALSDHSGNICYHDEMNQFTRPKTMI